MVPFYQSLNGINLDFSPIWTPLYQISGSLVVRIVFLPFEESSFATFARSASGLFLSSVSLMIYCVLSWINLICISSLDCFPSCFNFHIQFIVFKGKEVMTLWNSCQLAFHIIYVVWDQLLALADSPFSMSHWPQPFFGFALLQGSSMFFTKTIKSEILLAFVFIFFTWFHLCFFDIDLWYWWFH